MRQGQNNSKRSRGRGRKPQQHSANRAYDSNGPDVKVRGTAAHVCEKYQQLARDAISSGDRVMAENYYQHAEHYYRLLMAAQVGQESQQRQQSNLGYRPNEDDEPESEAAEAAENNVQPRHPGQPWHEDRQPQYNGNGRSRDGMNGNGQNVAQANGHEAAETSAPVTDEAVATEAAPAPAAANEEVVASEEAPAPRRRRQPRRRPRADAEDAPRAEAEAGAAD